MHDAGRGPSLPEAEAVPAHPREVLALAAAYLDRAHGDARATLVEAVADGVAVTALVSRGFARWAPPARLIRRAG